MKKIFAAIITLLFFNTAFAGVYEDALAKKEKVFLYFYTPECSTCRAFNEIFDSVKTKNSEYEFVRVNVNTSYGMRLMLKFKGRYVPYIILTSSKTKKSVSLNHTCVMDEVCLMRAIKSFNG